MPSTSHQSGPGPGEDRPQAPPTQPLAPPAGAPAQPPAYPPPYYYAPPSHSGATICLVLGVLGLISLPALAPVAWFMGNSALEEIDARPGMYGNRDHAKIGRILGMVGSAILGFIVLAVLAMFGLWLVVVIGATASA